MRPKYVQANNAGIIIAPMIERPLPKAIVGAGLLAQIIIDKYVDHLPLYRQMERFKREGINIPYSTIGDWIKNGCTLIDPLYEALKKLILQSNYLHADESPIKVLDKDKKAQRAPYGGTSAGSVHRGYYWVYHNSIEGLVLFDYREGRGREGPVEVLENFKGYLPPSWRVSSPDILPGVRTDGFFVHPSTYKQLTCGWKIPIFSMRRVRTPAKEGEDLKYFLAD